MTFLQNSSKFLLLPISPKLNSFHQGKLVDHFQDLKALLEASSMVRFYDNWERLVEAVMHRELFRELSLCDSLSSSPCTSSSRDSNFSLTSNHLYNDSSLSHSITPSPLHPDAESMNQGKMTEATKLSQMRRNPIWKGLSIFKRFSLKKGYGRDDRELRWAETHKTLHGLPPIPTIDTAETARRKAELARLQRAHTLKGHIEAVLRTKGINLDSIPGHYTI